VQEIDQLFVDVAIVDVDGGRSSLESPEHSLEILDTVVKIERNVILPGFVIRERGTLDTATEPARLEVDGETARPSRHLAVRDLSPRQRDTDAIRNRDSDRFMHAGEIELHAGTS